MEDITQYNSPWYDGETEDPKISQESYIKTSAPKIIQIKNRHSIITVCLLIEIRLAILICDIGYKLLLSSYVLILYKQCKILLRWWSMTTDSFQELLFAVFLSDSHCSPSWVTFDTNGGGAEGSLE